MTSSIRILHVDDEPEFSDMFGIFLEREDDRFDVETAGRAGEALAYLADHTVDCIISDYDMPGRNGIEFLEAVREEHPDLPFILYTGKGSEEVAAEAISADVTDYLQKDSTTSQYTVLANRIRHAVDARRTAAEAERRRHRLEQILKTVPGCVVQLDADGRFVFANERAEEVLGLERDALTGRSYNDPDWDIRDLNGDPIPDEQLPFRRVRDSGEPVYGVRHSIRWPDGTRKVLLVNGAPLFDEEGVVDSVVFSLTDITDRQNRARELERTQRRLEFALKTTNTGVWEWDTETDDVVWSDSLERTLGLDPGEFEGTFEAFADRVHPDDRPEVRDEITRAIENESMYQTEFRMRHADGSYQWVEVRGQIIRDDDGERMVGVHHDITRQKERETRVERQQSLLEAQQEAMIDGLLVVDEDGEIVSYNDRFVDLWEIPREIVEQHDDESALEWAMDQLADPDEFRRKVEYLYDHPQETARDEIVLADGRVFDRHTAPVIGDDGTHYGRLWTFRDITEQKQLRAELSATAERYRTLAENLPKGAVFLYNEELECLLADGGGLSNVGLSKDEIVGSRPSDRYPDSIAEEIETHLRRAFDGKETEFEQTYNDRHYLVRTAPIRTDEGDITQVMAVSQDITEQRERERNLERQNTQLEEFASVLSHDLRNPLRTAQGYVELAGEECASEHLTSIADAHDRIESIIEHLLWLAREGQDIGATEVVDLTDVVDETWAMTSTDAEMASLSLADGEAEPVGRIVADRTRLQQLLENLFRNAIEHGGENVTVRVGRLEDGFYVEDDGPGIPADEREDVFEVGYTAGDGGTGFGLGIVDRIVEAHGWQITVTEGSAGGARFEVTGVEISTE